MAKLVQTNLSMMMINKRLEPDFFINDQKMKVSSVNCASVISFCQYGTSKDLNDNGVGFPILRLNEFDGYFVNEHPSKTCSYINQETFESLSLKKGDILVCRTNGNPELVGKTAIVLDDLQIAFASYLFRIRTNDVILPEVMLLYLNSSHGRNEIRRHLIRNNQSNFSPAKLRLLNVPLFSSKLQLALSNFVQRAYLFNTKSKKCFEYSTSLFINGIGFANQSINTANIWVQRLNDVLNLSRLDPEFWKPARTIKNHTVPFSSQCNLTESSPNFTNDMINYIELSNIDSRLGVVDSHSVISSDLVPSRAKRQVLSGDLLLSTIEGSLDKIALISENENGYIASSGFLQIRPKNCTNEFLLVYFKSVFGQQQLKKICGGSILSAIQTRLLDYIEIPIIDKKIEKEITTLVQQSHQLRRESKRLLEVAKKTVEIAIEESEEKAMQYLNENQATNIEY